jgi:hypothetical protein
MTNLPYWRQRRMASWLYSLAEAARATGPGVRRRGFVVTGDLFLGSPSTRPSYFEIDWELLPRPTPQ